jgi:hypothetical protein
VRSSNADRVAYSRLCSVMSKEGRPCGWKVLLDPCSLVTATCGVFLCEVGFGQANIPRYYKRTVKINKASITAEADRVCAATV